MKDGNVVSIESDVEVIWMDSFIKMLMFDTFQFT
jgi:hypothetical protein